MKMCTASYGQILPSIGVSGMTMKGDLMHIKHLGVDQYFLASVLAVLFRDILTGDTKTKEAKLWRDIRAAYEDRVWVV